MGNKNKGNGKRPGMPTASSPKSPQSRMPSPAQAPVEGIDAPPLRAGAVTRDQHWAVHAYDAVARVPVEERRDYKIAVNDLGANILRSGLVAAIAAVQRLGERSTMLLDHLAEAGVTGIGRANGKGLPAMVRALDIDGYILATREILQVATWLKRAVQATFGDE